MKITNKQLKQIIKEELMFVLNEGTNTPNPSDMNLPSEEATRKVLSLITSGKPEELKTAISLIDALGGNLLWIKEYLSYKDQEIFNGYMGSTMRDLADLKLKMYLKNGCEESEEDCWVDVSEIDVFHGKSIHELLGDASDAGWFEEDDGYDEDYRRVNLRYLLPGKFTPDQLPIFDEDNDEFYNDSNLRTLAARGFTEDSDPYTFNARGEEIKKSLGL